LRRKVASEERIDLLITDLFMPEKDGIELILHFRRSLNPPKIIAVSGVWYGQDLDTARVLGADAVFEKPLHMAELLATVARLLTPNSGSQCDPKLDRRPSISAF
jgi:DNA-binding response OmpR family regulator